MRTNYRKRVSFARGAAFLLIAALCAALAVPGTARAGRAVRLALQWYPQAQFAGYYMALEKGLYAERGLYVTILPGSANNNSLSRVVDGRADFCTAFLSSALEYRDKGEELVNVGQFVRKSALMLVARKDSGIKSVKDLDGRRIGTWGDNFQLQPVALFKRENLDVTLVRQSPSFELFMRGGLDAAMAMWYNEYHRLISYGLNPEEMTAFFFSDLDLNQPEDGLYCLESTLEMWPGMAAAMVEASAEGWRYAFAHPEETVDVILRVMKKANVRANRAHQAWMLARMKDIILPDGAKDIDTRLRQADYERTRDALRSSGVIENDIPYNDFHKEAAR
ncbi:MAG: ABC transporter substrate-binding protein [Desulfovibrionaceae bacterium]|nr:ABC transporter substrate-binding protein [Desulfovibrionaceae bacterium]